MTTSQPKSLSGGSEWSSTTPASPAAPRPTKSSLELELERLSLRVQLLEDARVAAKPPPPVEEAPHVFDPDYTPKAHCQGCINLNCGYARDDLNCNCPCHLGDFGPARLRGTCRHDGLSAGSAPVVDQGCDHCSSLTAKARCGRCGDGVGHSSADDDCEKAEDATGRHQGLAAENKRLRQQRAQIAAALHMGSDDDLAEAVAHLAAELPEEQAEHGAAIEAREQTAARCAELEASNARFSVEASNAMKARDATIRTANALTEELRQVREALGATSTETAVEAARRLVPKPVPPPAPRDLPIPSAPPGSSCGTCVLFVPGQGSRCTARNVGAAASDKACLLYKAAEQ
jgi:hypothetical protein